jgi:hypothetical protein
VGGAQERSYTGAPRTGASPADSTTWRPSPPPRPVGPPPFARCRASRRSPARDRPPRAQTEWLSVSRLIRVEHVVRAQRLGVRDLPLASSSSRASRGPLSRGRDARRWTGQRRRRYGPRGGGGDLLPKDSVPRWQPALSRCAVRGRCSSSFQPPSQHVAVQSPVPNTSSHSLFSCRLLGRSIVPFKVR